MRQRGLIISVIAVLSLVGCGGGDAGQSETTKSYAPFRIPVGVPPIRYDTELDFKPNGLAGPELKPVFPDGPPPEFLASQDLVDGIGDIADEGDTVTVQYVGAFYDSRKKFASSWDAGHPFTFTMGEGEAIPGWEEGLAGLETADQRELVIPPSLTADGTRMKDVPQGETLIYVIELLRVHSE
jgi:peptidylprolyl isomerase